MPFRLPRWKQNHPPKSGRTQKFGGIKKFGGTQKFGTQKFGTQKSDTQKFVGIVAALLAVGAGIVAAPAAAAADPAPVIECENVGNGDLCLHLWGDDRDMKTVRIAASYQKKTGPTVWALVFVASENWQPSNGQGPGWLREVANRYETTPMSPGELARGYVDLNTVGQPSNGCFKAVLSYQFVGDSAHDLKTTPSVCVPRFV